MSDIHIDDFYHDSAAILIQLYDAFPKKASVYVDTIIGSQSLDEYGVPNQRHLACFATMLWLQEENYLRYASPLQQSAIDHAVLTQEAFLRLASLRQPPVAEHPELPNEVAEQQQSLAQQIRLALQSKSSARIKQTMRIFFTEC